MFRTINTLTGITFHHTTSFSIHCYTIVQFAERGSTDVEVLREDKFVILAFTGYYFRAPFKTQIEAEAVVDRLFDEAQKGPLVMTAQRWTEHEDDVTSNWGEGQPSGLAGLRAVLHSLQDDPNELFIGSIFRPPGG